jgi:hypothetical protein
MLAFGRHGQTHEKQTLKEETRGNVVLNQGNVRVPEATPMAVKQNGQRLFEKTQCRIRTSHNLVGVQERVWLKGAVSPRSFGLS